MQRPVQNEWMYVSTSLDFIFLQSSSLTDIELDGRCFRRLDPFFFAWLEHVLSSSSSASQLEEGGADIRFQRALLAPIRDFAESRMPRTDLDGARKRLRRSGVYHPPRTARGTCAATHPGDNAAPRPTGRPAFARTPAEHIAKDLEIILTVASRKGFARKDLFGAGSELAYPLGNDWGLACFLHDGLRIEHIEPGAIVLAGPPPRRSRLVWRPREQRRSDLFSQLPR